MVANDDFDGKATHLNCFYMHMIFEQKYPKSGYMVNFYGFLRPSVTRQMIYIIFNFPLFRHFDQSTKFGAMLDMLTDRCATMCLLATLGTFYPNWLFFFQLSMTIDISCHWIYLHTTTLQVQFSISKKAAKFNGIF